MHPINEFKPTALNIKMSSFKNDLKCSEENTDTTKDFFFLFCSISIDYKTCWKNINES